MKILITGAAGFIGSHLVQKLLCLGHEVVGIDNIIPLDEDNDQSLKYDRLREAGLRGNIEWWENPCRNYDLNYCFIRMDILNNETLDNLFHKERFQVVCHLAACAGVRRSFALPGTYVRTNVEGFVNVLEACKNHKIQHLVYASSSSVYGNNKIQTDAPISVYAATKKSNELLAHVYHHAFGLKVTGLRFFTVYGEWGRPDMAPFIFTKAILENRSIKLNVMGKSEIYITRDFTHVEDTVKAISLVVDKGHELLGCNTFDVGMGNPVSLNRLIEVIELLTGKQAIRQYDRFQTGDVRDTKADIFALRSIGFTAQVCFQDGMKRFVDWFKKYYGYE